MKYVDARASVSFLLLVLMFLGAGALVSASEAEDIVEQQRSKQLQLIADALVDTSVHIAYCRIPVSPQLSVSNDGNVAETQANFSEAAVVLSLSRMSVIEAVRGEMDSVIFVRFMPVLNESGYLPLFTYMAGSEWLLFLGSPFSSERPDDETLMNKFHELKAQTFLSDRNFFTVRSHGSEALCVKWPNTINNRPLIVATSNVVGDMRLIIDYITEATNRTDSTHYLDSTLDHLQDEYGKLLFEKVLGKQ